MPDSKPIIESIRDYILSCDFLKDGKVNIDYIKDKPQSYSVDETPAEPVLNYFRDGGRRLQILFDFSIQASFSVLENIKNSKFCDNFFKWIYEQNKTGNLPKIENVDWIKCLGRGTISQTAENTAIYTIPMQVAYTEPF